MALSSYSLITRNVDYSSYTLFLLGALVLFVGIEKLRNDRKVRGYVCILVALFVLLVSLQGFCN
ncbi:YczI family protein [Peribacillus butanolivorans]|uniref:YczI family protein n=1 Tax=Peribacillus butanolivorans TaxID=421767 RepID=UPI0036620B0E